jgi:hypothetical protein
MQRSHAAAAFKAEHVVKKYTMNLSAEPAVVFPLLCPVREYEWIEPWSCDMVFFASGVAENNAVFRTDFPAKGGRETWILCRYEKDRTIEFIRVVPEFKVNRLDVALTAAGGSNTINWFRTYNGLSEAGNRWIRPLTDETYRTGKTVIEKLLNHYLKTGSMPKWAILCLRPIPMEKKQRH